VSRIGARALFWASWVGCARAQWGWAGAILTPALLCDVARSFGGPLHPDGC